MGHSLLHPRVLSASGRDRAMSVITHGLCHTHRSAQPIAPFRVAETARPAAASRFEPWLQNLEAGSGVTGPPRCAANKVSARMVVSSRATTRRKSDRGTSRAPAAGPPGPPRVRVVSAVGQLGELE